MGGLKTYEIAPTTGCSQKNSPMTQNDHHRRIFSRQKDINLVSGEYEGGKHGNSKILQVFYLYKA